MRYLLSCTQALFFFTTICTDILASAEEAQGKLETSSTRLVVAHLEDKEVSRDIEGYLLLDDGRWIAGKGVVVRQNKTVDEESHSLWAMRVSAEVREVEELVLSEENSEGLSSMYQVNRNSFFLAPIENSEVVRRRISLLRQQLEQLQDERERIERAHDTLTRDAQLIGQEDTIKKLEQDVRDVDKHISRIRMQREDFRNEMRSLKAWPEPLDIRERKQAYVRDLRELQEKEQDQ